MPTLSSVAGLIPSLATAGGITIERRNQKVQNKYGEWELAAPTYKLIKPAVIHNLSGRDLDQVPEADRNVETIQIYTWVRLFVSDNGKDSDRAIYRGRRFKVIQCQDYELQGGVYISQAQLEDLQTP